MAIAHDNLGAGDARVQRLARNLRRHRKAWLKTQPLRGGKPPGWRTLAVLVDDQAPGLKGSSFWTIQKLHAGNVEWQNLRLPIVMALAHIYGVTLRQLSPDLAELYAPRDSNPEPAEYGPTAVEESDAFAANAPEPSMAAVA